MRLARKGISAGNIIVGDSALTKICIQDEKRKCTQHYRLRHSTRKFPGENLFLVNGNDFSKSSVFVKRVDRI